MSSQIIFGLITVILAAITYAPLIISNLKGKLQSHPVTWAILTLSGGTNAVIQLFNNAGHGAWSPLFSTACAFILTIVSFFTYKKPAASLGAI